MFLVKRLLFICLICISIRRLTLAVLDCQGSDSTIALANCPDAGAQQNSAGGNVTILVQYATNMPNYDHTGPSAGVSDPYVKLKVRNTEIVKTTRNIRNNLNPVWNEEVNLGVLLSTTLITLEIWDKDSGLEFTDDLMFTGSFRVPFCSYFSANETTVDCGEPFNCASDDSLWQLPTRKQCVNTGLINFNSRVACGSTSAVCIFFTVKIIPFIMEVEKTYSDAITTTPTLSVAGSATSGTAATWISTYNFGQPFIGSTYTISTTAASSSSTKGALMLRTNNADRSYGAAEALRMYLGFNFAATVYVCRDPSDNINGVPDWITKGYSSLYLLARIVTLSNGDTFECYLRTIDGTVKNRWGGILSGAEPFYTNTISGYDTDSQIDQAFYAYNYIVLATPITSTVFNEFLEIIYDALQFVNYLFSYGLITLWFVYLAFRFLNRIDYRMDRISNYIVTRVMTGDDRCLLATLLLDFNKSPANIEYRAHMYHLRNGFLFLLAAPLWMLIAWGVSVSFMVRPRILGIAVAFGGVAMCFYCFAYRLWERSNWRLSLMGSTAIAMGLFSYTLFLLISLYLETGVLDFGYEIDFTALSLIFGTINCIPGLLLVFLNDRSHKVYMDIVIAKLRAGLYFSKNNAPVPETTSAKDSEINRLLHAILGESYSINPRLPALRYAAVMHEVKPSYNNHMSSVAIPEAPISSPAVTGTIALPPPGSKANPTTAAASESQANVEEDDNQQASLSEERQIYGWSLLILFIYLMVAVSSTSQGSLAFLNICALILFDGILLSMSKGESAWSPGFKVIMLVKSRILICGSPPSLWLLNYSACYLLFSNTLLHEVVNIIMPRLSEKRAGQIVFGGESYTNISESLRTTDLSGNPLFCVVILTIAFSAVLVISIYLPQGSSSQNNQLFVPNLTVLGMHDWPIYIFGLIALCLTVVFGSALATYRAFSLEAYGLLKGWAKETYIMRKEITLPFILAFVTEFSFLLTGLLVYAIVRSAAVLIGAVLLPAIFLCLGRALRVWINNDYELVPWPRKSSLTASNAEEAKKKGKKSGNDDLENAYSMVGNYFGNDENGNNGNEVKPFDDNGPESAENKDGTELEDAAPAGKVLQGFRLPPLKATGAKAEREIKMPPLPLKSVLRRKRQNLGIKTQGVVPVVQDLRIRDTAPEADLFGNKPSDVIDIDDPWAQFEINEQEELLKHKKKGLVVTKKKVESSILKRINLFLKNSKTFQALKQAYLDCWKFIKRKAKVYPQIYKPNLDDTEGDDHDDNKEGDEEDDDDEEEEDGEHNDNKDDEEKQARHIKKKKKTHTITKDNTTAVVEEVDVNKLSFSDAFWGGYLTDKEYDALWSWYGGMMLIMIFGISLAKVVSPSYLGYVIWIALWQFILVTVPLIKYFNVYKFDATSWRLFRFSGLVHFLFCVCFFAAHLNGSIQIVGSLWIMDFFFYFPLFVYIIFSAWRWIDSGFQSIIVIDRNQDGQISLYEMLGYAKTFPGLMIWVILLNWQFYTWLNYTAGMCVTLFLVLAGLSYFYIRDWAINDYFLSPELAIVGKFVIYVTMFIAFMVALFDTSTKTIFSWSVFFFAWGLRYVLKIASRYMEMKNGTYFFFSPYIMPVYSYNGQARDLTDETELVSNVIMLFLIMLFWSTAMIIFFYPIHIGVAITCGLFLSMASLAALSVSYVPRQLAKSSALILPETVKEAADAAKYKFHDRRLPLNLEMKNYEAEMPDAEIEKDPPPKTLIERLKERTCLENALSVMTDIRSTKYVREDAKMKEEAARLAAAEDEKDVYELPWYKQWLLQAKDFARDLYELLPIDKEHGYRKHNQAPFNAVDAFVEMFFRGRGAFAMFGLGGSIYRQLIKLKDSRYLKRLYPSWTENYNEFGVNVKLVDIAEPVDYVDILSRVREMDKALDYTFAEESRCAILFLMMVLVSSDAKLDRERVLFQKFLRENRFKLASNGISPPADIFVSSSFASINIPFTAIWLGSLTKEEQERFHTLKMTFNLEQSDRDFQIDRQDKQYHEESEAHRLSLLKKDEEWHARIAGDILKMKEQRIQRFEDSLEGADRLKFMERRDAWSHNALETFIRESEQSLYQRFLEACVNTEHNDLLEHAVECLTDCETAQRDIRLGEYGRQYQFVDSEFMPSDKSIGDGEAISLVLGWRCAPGIVEHMELFEGGTHPDDVCMGVFCDQWLLSALSMLVASGSTGKGMINEQIRGLFVPHPSIADGSSTTDTEVGAYCVKIFRNGEWIPILLDDLLPMRKKDFWTNENRGVAGAHVRECRGLWVSLIEKAFAKFFGSYAKLERGFVHHALRDLTGCDAESISLSPYARGLNKLTLWDNLVEWKKNGYILGAGTGPADLVDTEIHEMGICFDAAYIIYDVRMVDSYRLIKLRNPPGDHEEWTGDWSDHSPLWTQRLKYKAGYRDDDQDNVFFMSFDDFLNVFRYLYICKYYNPKKWIEIEYGGRWKRANEHEVEQMEINAQMLMDQQQGSSSTGEHEGIDVEAQNRRKAKARLDSAGGLPSRHNPGCILENNPHYSLRIFRPTDLRITVTQFQEKGTRSPLIPHPFSILVVRNSHPNVPTRLTNATLKKEDVVCWTGEPRAEKTLHLYANGLEAGLYMVIVGAYVSGMEGHFHFKVLSNYRCDCLPIWPPAWMLKDENKLIDADAQDKDPKNKRVVKGSRNAAQQGFKKLETTMRKGLRALLGAGEDFDDDEPDADEKGSKPGSGDDGSIPRSS